MSKIKFKKFFLCCSLISSFSFYRATTEIGWNKTLKWLKFLRIPVNKHLHQRDSFVTPFPPIAPTYLPFTLPAAPISPPLSETDLSPPDLFRPQSAEKVPNWKARAAIFYPPRSSKCCRRKKSRHGVADGTRRRGRNSGATTGKESIRTAVLVRGVSERCVRDYGRTCRKLSGRRVGPSVGRGEVAKLGLCFENSEASVTYGKWFYGSHGLL